MVPFRNVTLGVLIILLATFWHYHPAKKTVEGPSTLIKGITLVAPPKPLTKDPIQPIKVVHANWVAIVPYAYTPPNSAHVFYNSSRQWWGERPEGTEKCIDLAQQGGLKVFLKPQVYLPGSWPGALEFATEKDWLIWEKDYRTFIMEFVDIAARKNVTMFCVGTEFKVSSQTRPAFWRTLIKDIRKKYKGRLTYAANWDEFENVPFWDDLDYIGIDAYFPLIAEKTPSVAKLKNAWKPWKLRILRTSKLYSKPTLFTEFGYLSVDGCADKTWELETNIHSLAVNQQAQQNALDALFSAFWNESYWHGGFLWKWFPNMQGHEGYPDKDYTPQGKLAAKTLKEWYGKH